MVSEAEVAVGTGTGGIAIRHLETDRFTSHFSGHTGRILMLGFMSDEDASCRRGGRHDARVGAHRAAANRQGPNGRLTALCGRRIRGGRAGRECGRRRILEDHGHVSEMRRAWTP